MLNRQLKVLSKDCLFNPMFSFSHFKAEVARLFAPYSARPARPTTTMAPPAKRLCRTTYTHTFFCLSDHMGDQVPAKNAKLELTAAGLGEKRITFQGNIMIN